MSVVSRVLERLVQGYRKAVKDGGVECRIVIPGLTPAIADDLHRRLCAAQLPSFLVVPPTIEPSKADRKLRPEGLTSLRHGDMIIIAWPGEISRIQDSIIGAGGTVRTFTFSDEWPWIDDGNEYFRFVGPFIEALLDEWRVQQADREWFKVVVSDLLGASLASVERAEVVLDQILGSFDPAANAGIATLRGKFLFHCGLPMPEDISEDVESLMERCGSLGKAIGSARLEVDTRSDVLDRINEIEPDAQAAAVLQGHVEALLDGLAAESTKRYSGILTLRGSWGNTTARWTALPIMLLRRLFDPASLRPEVILKARLSVHGGITSPEQDHGILFEGGTAEIEITYDGLPADRAGQSQVVLLQGHRTLDSKVCQADLERDVVTFTVSYDQVFGNGAKKKAIRIQLRQPDGNPTEAKVSLTPCGTNSPLLVVLDPGFDVYSASADLQPDEDAESVEISEPVFVTVLYHDSSSDLGLDIDEESAPLVPDESDARISRYKTSIDPSGVPSGRRRLVATSGPVAVTLDLEAKDFERGEFTLERELIVQLGRGNSARVSQLVKVFAGTAQTPYAGLGGINDQSRRRSMLARVFENKSNGGLPIVLDLGAVSDEQVTRFGWVYSVPSVPAARLRAVMPGKPSQDLLKEYAAARAAVLDTVSEGEPPPQDKWPGYSWFPIFVEKRRTKVDAAIAKYLDAYAKISKFLATHAPGLSWEEAFVLGSLDCVIHLGGGELNAKVALLGPWHPLVVAKRFMVQSALLGSARRYGDRRNSSGFNRLVVLLDQVSAFRWTPVLNADATTFSAAYVAPTSDPGWLFAINADVLGSSHAVNLLIELRRSLGLESSLVPFAREQMAADYLKGFHRAYPTRRAIALSASDIYSPERIVQSAESVLYAGDSVSRLGNQLPGGLHLFVSNVDEIEQRTWRRPPVCIYDKKEAGAWSAEHRDILLLPPGKPKVSSVSGKEHPLARGTNDLAAFCAPVRRISLGAGGVPSSFAYERDLSERSGSGVGAAFTRALCISSQLFANPVYSGWVVEDLPETLQYLWNVVPGGQVDPAVLIRYVQTGFDAGQSRVLWDYNMSLTGPTNSYFVLSQVPQSIAVALSGCPPVKGESAKDIVRELGQIGLAAGSESLRSGSKARGVIGLVAAIRLFINTHGHRSPLDNSGNNRGFLLPVDSFKQILGDGLDGSDNQDSRRADLVACQLCLEATGRLKIYFAAIECKYSSGVLGDENADSALEQAARTYDRLRALADAAKQPTGIPERLAFLSLLSFGLRLRAQYDDNSLAIEHQMFQRVLDGQFDLGEPSSTSIAVVTECAGHSASFVRRKGIVIYLSPGHWPGKTESAPVGTVRDHLASLFMPPTPSERDVPPAPPTGPSDSPGAPDAGAKAPTAGPSVLTPEVTPKSPTAEDQPYARLTPILLGCTADRRKVTYDPQSEMRPLENYNVMITGSSGKGKTQLIKAMVADLRSQQRNVLLLDFKNDFASDPVFLETARLSCCYVTFDGLPYNPLIPMPVRHPQTGRMFLQISQHITGITAILTKTFGLGAQQEAALKDVIRDSYRDRGIDTSGSVEFNPEMEFPDFNDVGERLRASNPAAYNRMDPLFDLGVFSAACRRLNFEAVLRSPSVIDLSQIQSDTIKNAIAKIMVLSAHAFYNARPHSSELRQFFVFDEAHRILDTEFLVRFVRECRAYGVGVLLSSQNPSDFAPEVSASLNTKIIHGNGAEKERVKAILRILGLEDGETAAVSALGLFDAYISNPQNDAVKVRTFAYPHYLVLSEIQRRGKVRRGDLAVAGVDFKKLSPNLLLGALLEMGLVEEVDGVLAPI